MFKKQAFGKVFNVLLSFTLSFIMSIIALSGRDMLTTGQLLRSFLPAFLISLLLTSFLPMMKLGRGFAQLFTRDERSFLSYALSIVPSALIMSTSMSLIMMLMGAGKHFSFLNYLRSLPQSILMAYVIQLLIFKPLMALSRKLCVK